MKRYSMGFFQGAPAMFEQPDGAYVKWADVQALLKPGNPPIPTNPQPLDQVPHPHSRPSREEIERGAYGVMASAPTRCADCDLSNGCPEFCWCDAAGAGKAEYASWFPIRPRGVAIPQTPKENDRG